MIRSVFVKTYLQMAALFVLSVAVMIVILDYLYYGIDKRDFLDHANAEAEAIIYLLTQYETRHWEGMLKNYRSVLDLEIIRAPARPLSEWSPVERHPGLYFNEQGSESWQIARRIGDSKQYLILEEKIIPTYPTDIIDIIQFSPILLLFALFAIGSYVLARKIERPVREIAQGTLALSEGIFTTRLNENTFDEPFRSLSQRFNIMTEKIQQLMTEQQIMVGAVPHELRTPLAKIRFALDLTRSIDSLSELRDQMEKIDHYADSLQDIINDTLLLSQLQQEHDVFAQSIALESFIGQIAWPIFAELSINYSVEAGPGANEPAYGEERLIRRAIINILENAARYAKSEVHISLFRSGRNELRIAIDDDGPGVSPEDQKVLFIPFSRIDKSRSRKTGGAGLGLSLVALIMRRHGGEACYRPSKMGGASFILQWPAYDKKYLSMTMFDDTKVLNVPGDR